MKKKIFTMGKVYDLSTLGVNEIENAVQADLDKIFNAGGVRFLLREVSGKTLELTFLRKYRVGEIDWLNYDPKMIYNIDANIITDHSFNGFRVPDYCRRLNDTCSYYFVRGYKQYKFSPQIKKVFRRTFSLGNYWDDSRTLFGNIY